MFDYVGGVIQRNKNIILLLILGIIACSYLALCAVNPLFALALVFGSIALYMLFKNIDLSFMLYIISLPLSNVPFLHKLPLGLSAIKLQFAVLAVILPLFVLYKKAYKVNTLFKIFFITIMGLYIISWVRSLDFALKVFADNQIGELPMFRYLSSYVSWTFTAIIPLVVIVCFYRDHKGIAGIIRTFAVSAIILIGYLIFIYLFQISDRSDFEIIRTELAAFCGLHGNDIANYCIISFPVILAWALYKKGFFAFLTLFVIIAGTAICFSRTAYFMVLLGFVMFMILSGKMKWIPIAAVVIGVALYLFLPDMIVDRAATGILTGDSNELSAGRIDYIWEPLMSEFKTHPQTVLFGLGRYGFTNTDIWKQGRVRLVSHAHNMYLDCILDMGIFGLLVILAFFTTVLVYFIKNSRRYKKALPYYASLLNGCIVSITCYLISGLTGRTFFPTVSNVYLWIVIGLGIAICGYTNTPDAKVDMV